MLLLALLFWSIAGKQISAPPLSSPWAESAAEVNTVRQLSLIVALKEQNLNKVSQKALAASTPGSTSYGQFLSVKQLQDLTAPTREGRLYVLEWLAECNPQFTGPSSITVTASLEKWEELLQTRFRVLTNSQTKKTVIRATDYIIPNGVADYIDAIFGLHGLPLPPRKRRKAPRDESGAGLAKVTPSVLYELYNITGYAASGSKKNRQAVAEFQGQSSAEKDQREFFLRYAPFGYKLDYQLYSVVGYNNKRDPGDEASLDVQYIMGTAPGLLTELWGFEGEDFCKDMKNYTDLMTSIEDVPFVFSISYGWQGDLNEVGCKTAEVNNIDVGFMKTAARGISLVISSGDSGSGYPESVGECQAFSENVEYEGEGKTEINCPYCITPFCCLHAAEAGFAYWTMAEDPEDGYKEKCYGFKNVTNHKVNDRAFSGQGPASLHLYPSWPASSPWVTAVGGTKFVDQNADPTAEEATDEFGSGGGFSFQFPRDPTASYQDDATQGYLQEAAADLPPAGWYNPDGRGTPDVSALGEDYRVVVDGEVEIIGGTSASAPVFAAIAALLNDARMAQGKSPLGLLNPLIYQNPSAFKDITRGTNKIDRGGDKVKYGYDCAEGWDPVTGLGTPHFDKLLAAALKASASKQTE